MLSIRQEHPYSKRLKKEIAKILEKYNGIESEDIRNISKKYFDFKKLNISIIGDYQESYVKSFIDYYIFNKI